MPLYCIDGRYHRSFPCVGDPRTHDHPCRACAEDCAPDATKEFASEEDAIDAMHVRNGTNCAAEW